LLFFLFFFSRPIDGNGRTRRTKELGKGLKIEAQLIIAIPFLSARSCVICAVCFFLFFFWPLRKIRLFICLAFFQKGLFFQFDFAGFFCCSFCLFPPVFFFFIFIIIFCVAIHAALAARKLLYRSTARSISGFSNGTPAPFHPSLFCFRLLSRHFLDPLLPPSPLVAPPPPPPASGHVTSYQKRTWPISGARARAHLLFSTSFEFLKSPWEKHLVGSSLPSAPGVSSSIPYRACHSDAVDRHPNSGSLVDVVIQINQ
jgi:hypothetical protein